MRFHLPGEGLPRPRLVLAHADPIYDLLACRCLHRLGWDVSLASSGPEARRLARELDPLLVVLDARLHQESGWLTCDKLTGELPGLRVVLVTARPTSEDYAFAYFVGAAALVDQDDGLASLAEEVGTAALPAVSGEW